ncbi:YjcZ family sporulation protein [Paenibacillus sp. LHD-38]|nr:YjcZ family sporulation protein [Paenibacillus sp. LHD-38]MDQ8736756.1 YjcZ family sporulation protein [Paenibacillus sp. LHD-38]
MNRGNWHVRCTWRFTSLGVILVLFILLVIISRSVL